MPKASYARTVYYLLMDEEKSIDPQLTLACQQLGSSIHLVHPQELLAGYHHTKHKILLIDHHRHQALRQQLSPLTFTDQRMETILFNVEKRLTTDQLLSFGHLKGLFYRSTPPQQITRGLAEIINGQNWLPRHVSNQLLHHFRYAFQDQQTRAILDLTVRELEILRYLQTQATNVDIANSLFISELTVKSHLYQIYKKIAVKNRQQAINWANDHLSCG